MDRAQVSTFRVRLFILDVEVDISVRRMVLHLLATAALREVGAYSPRSSEHEPGGRDDARTR